MNASKASIDPRTAALVRISNEAAAAGHGGKEAVYQRAIVELGISRGTLMRQLADIRVTNRRQRSDAGQCTLPIGEAQLISAALMAGYRKNSKRILSIDDAVTMLRANGAVIAGRVDEGTGEIFPLSASAISRALRTYQLHPDQLRQPTPYQTLKSNHPNHVWQLDGSVCVVYYLEDGHAMVELDDAEHYKNKPHNLRAIEQQRVIRYVVTDHTTGVIRWRYYPHAETGEHTCRFLAWAMAPKDNAADPFHGRPRILMVDPGATGSGLVKRFCIRLGINLIVNRRRNPRAKGQVEKAQDIVERAFESGLRFCRRQVRNFDELNDISDLFQNHFNRSAVHTRHGKTRYSAWLTIAPDQLLITRPAEELLMLATHEPHKRKVSGDLKIDYRGAVYDVSAVPGVMVGGHVFVHLHPFRQDTAMAVLTGEDGHETHIELPEVPKDDWGFKSGSAEIGVEYKSRGDTNVDRNRKRIERLMTERLSEEDVERELARKDFVPFGGAIDPYKHVRTAPEPSYLPRRGQQLQTPEQRVEEQPIGLVAAMKQLRDALGRPLSAQENQWLRKKFPDGIQRQQMEGLTEQLAGQTEQARTARG